MLKRNDKVFGELEYEYVWFGEYDTVLLSEKK